MFFYQKVDFLDRVKFINFSIIFIGSFKKRMKTDFKVDTF